MIHYICECHSEFNPKSQEGDLEASTKVICIQKVNRNKH